MQRPSYDSTAVSGTRSIAALATRLAFADLPIDVVHAAKRHLIDTCGAIIAGVGRDAAQAVIATGSVAPGAPSGLPVPGTALRLAKSDFAYLAGTAAHGIELDDGYRPGSVHPGVAVVPAALAAAASGSRSGRDLLAALVVGYETVTAIAEACHPALKNRGFHPTSVVGPFGAAAATARLLDLDDIRIGHALGIAASASGGLFAFLGGGGDVKRLHAGQAARGGMIAAYLAAAGLTGPDDILERPSGFAQAFAFGDARDQLRFTLPPDAPFRIRSCYVKPYPCCRHLQPAIEALLSLRADHELQARDVTSVSVETYAIASSHAETGWPDFASAQLSFPYLMATALKHGSIRLAHFERKHLDDPEIAAIARLFAFNSSQEMDQRYPIQRPARVTIVARGKTYSKDVAEALGAPELPLSDDGLGAKFLDLVGPVLGNSMACGLLDHLWKIEGATDIRATLERMTASN